MSIKISSKSRLGALLTGLFSLIGSSAAYAKTVCHGQYFDSLGRTIDTESLTCSSAYYTSCSCSGTYTGSGQNYELALSCNYIITHDQIEWTVTSAMPYTSCSATKIVTP